ARHGCTLQDFVRGRVNSTLQAKLGQYDEKLQNNTFAIQGPWLTYTEITGGRELFLPPPANLWVSGPPGQQITPHLLSPQEEAALQGKHWDLTAVCPELRPLSLPQTLPGAWQPEPGSAYLSQTAMQQYLAGTLQLLRKSRPESHFYLRESRAGNRIAPESWSTAEDYLFFTEHLRFQDALSGNVYRRAGLAVVANTLEPADIGTGCLYVGGERRQAVLDCEVLAGKLIPEDAQVLATIQARRRFLVYLATPAIFSQGWQRPWPFPPGAKLVGAAVGKPLRLSGWSRGEHHAGGRPRPFFRAIPAGSVYFFTAPEWEAEQFQALYTRFHCQESLSEHYASAGLGVALVGVW
ncbi:MAG: type III-B CRISPR module-associated Cmr3 family protein, partial [Desulfobacca sp.]|uniref:type III-B CRISPR module-associated Cmr3 family protein n=1 Tax=Desulfobacca sp. TaxID=2067990 RepID=UPI004049F017